MATPRIGFIGQGWIGKHYADDFEQRGHAIVRYGLENEYAGNKERIKECDIVFIAVPTPTTVNGFDDSILRAVLPLVGAGKTAVIKSTLLPGTTEALQRAFPTIYVLNSPEFLREANAAYDAAHPVRTFIGISEDTPAYHALADAVLFVLPESSYTRIVSAREAELIKYAGNVFLTIKVVYANMLYDLAHALEADYDVVKEALAADPRIGASHLSVQSASGHTTTPGRGAGGHCFIKDLEAFRRMYSEEVGDALGKELLRSIAAKNNAFLKDSGKDLDLLAGIYGDHYDVLP